MAKYKLKATAYSISRLVFYQEFEDSGEDFLLKVHVEIEQSPQQRSWDGHTGNA